MLTTFTLTVLLASMIASPVEAAPYRRNVGLVKLPLTRMHKARDDIHPLILLQQHANSAHRRLARMTGQREPSAEEMSAAIHKRMVIVGNGKVDAMLARVREAANANAPAAAAQDGGVAVVTTTTTVPAALAATPTSASASTTIVVTVTVTAGSPAATDPVAGAPPAEAAASAAPSSTTAAAPAATGDAGSSSAPVGNNNDGYSKVELEGLLSEGVTNSTTPTTANSLALDIKANDIGYISTIQIGTPPREFRLLMDSGSSDMWVGSENCQRCGKHRFLGPKSSSSFKSAGRPFQVTYGSGDIKGDVITDDVIIAGLKLPAHTFGVTTAESPAIANEPFDGLVGLAKAGISEQRTDTPPESLAKAGLIQAAITSYKIPRLGDQKNDGEITFGGIDETKIDTATVTTMANTNQDGFWAVPFTVSVGGKDIRMTGRNAILDTGTSLVVAPPADAAAVHAQIPGARSDGQGGFILPCTTKAQVAFTMGGRSFSIDPRDLLFAPVNPNDPKGDCLSGIIAGDFGGPQNWLVGDVFLKNVYFSHDVGKNAITLANLK